MPENDATESTEVQPPHGEPPHEESVGAPDHGEEAQEGAEPAEERVPKEGEEDIHLPPPFGDNLDRRDV